MSKATKKNIITSLIVLPLILLATSIQYLTYYHLIPTYTLIIRTGIHFALLIAWCLSIKRRIIQTQVRKYLFTIITLMIFWILLKTIKYSINDTDIKRYLWYLYYIPMLFIPLFSLLVSMSLAKNENYLLPKWTKLLYIPTTLLFLLVLTNDYHQTIFSFHTGIMTDLNYQYEIGYYVILIWIILCALSSFINMLRKSRIIQNKTILLFPLLPLSLSFIYTVSYINNFNWITAFIKDMTVIHCFLIYSIFESCIQCGLIQSNIGYNELFEATTLPIQITNTDYEITHVSHALKEPIEPKLLKQMQTSTILLDNNTLLKKYELHNGYVYWKEDISEMNALWNELELTRDELKDTGDILAVENSQREKLLRLTEENKLYDLMAKETSKQIEMINDHLSKIKNTDDIHEARTILGQIIIIGTYIKRRNNLIFVGAQNGLIPSKELQLCLNESSENINYYGIACYVNFMGETLLTLNQATSVYDLFEKVVEESIESLIELLISIEITDEIEMNICALCSKSLKQLQDQIQGIEYEQDDDNLQYFRYTIKERES